MFLLIQRNLQKLTIRSFLVEKSENKDKLVETRHKVLGDSELVSLFVLFGKTLQH